MSKFNNTITPGRHGVVGTTDEVVLTSEGGVGFTRDAKSELFLAGVGAFFGEDKFYRSSDEGAIRFRKLVKTVTSEDPEWVAAFLSWLRHSANIRTAALVGAAEYIRAGGAGGRRVVASVLARADEPGEILAYWVGRYGRRIPAPLKRGIADAVVHLYSQKSVAKWDSGRRAFRFADVVELVHPSPLSENQSALFKFLLDDRHGRGDLSALPSDWLHRRSLALAADEPREALLRELERGNPTVTWETVSSAGTGKMSAQEWMVLYPHMKFFARLRNLRNLDEAEVPAAFKHMVGAELASPEAVRTSRVLPMRFLSAFLAVKDPVWHPYLSAALEESLGSVPSVDGRWLVLVDASGSMDQRFSDRSRMTYYQAACMFAAAFARRNDAVVRTFSNDLSPVLETRDELVLETVGRLQLPEFWIGFGTYTASCLEQAFKEGTFDKVLILTDEQHSPGPYWAEWGRDPGTVIPETVPMYTMNIAGYEAAHTESRMNRVAVGGLSDAVFQMIAEIEKTKDGVWPWQH